MRAELLRAQDATLWCAQTEEAPLQIGAVALFMVLAAIAGFADSAVVLFALCAVAMGGFLLDHLKNGPRAERGSAQASQRAQTE